MEKPQFELVNDGAEYINQRQHFCNEYSLEEYFGFSKINSPTAFFYLYKKFGGGNEFYDDSKQYGCYSFSPKDDKETLLSIYLLGSTISFYCTFSEEKNKIMRTEHKNYVRSIFEQVKKYAKEKYNKIIIADLGYCSIFSIEYNREKDLFTITLPDEFEEDANMVFERYCKHDNLEITQDNIDSYFWSDGFRGFYNKEFNEIAEELFGIKFYRLANGMYDYNFEEKENKNFFKNYISQFNKKEYPNIHNFFKVLKDFKSFMKEYEGVRDVYFNLWGR